MKICCVASVEEAQLAIRYGASALGLVSEMPSGPGPIPENLIAEIAAVLPPLVISFLLTSKQDPSDIVAQHRRCRTNVIQLCDRIEISDYEKLKSCMPGIGLVQVVHVTGKEAIDEACTVAPYVNGILLDSGNRALRVKELGGTGRIHDWTISRLIRDKVAVPIFLAGGLNANNVAKAVKRVQPFGVDVCSGVRTRDRLDVRKLSAFFKAVSSCAVPQKSQDGE